MKKDRATHCSHSSLWWKITFQVDYSTLQEVVGMSHYHPTSFKRIPCHGLHAGSIPALDGLESSKPHLCYFGLNENGVQKNWWCTILFPIDTLAGYRAHLETHPNVMWGPPITSYSKLFDKPITTVVSLNSAVHQVHVVPRKSGPHPEIMANVPLTKSSHPMAPWERPCPRVVPYHHHAAPRPLRFPSDEFFNVQCSVRGFERSS